MAPIIDSLPFDDIVVWDNSVETDEAVYGRYLGIERAKNETIYVQDDDLVFRGVSELLSAYDPGAFVTNMWPRWFRGARKLWPPKGYNDLVYGAAGGLFERGHFDQVIKAYLERWPLDRFFKLEVDAIVGIAGLPHRSVDLQRFVELRPEQKADYRMCKSPDYIPQRAEALRRGRALRDELRRES